MPPCALTEALPILFASNNTLNEELEPYEILIPFGKLLDPAVSVNASVTNALLIREFVHVSFFDVLPVSVISPGVNKLLV